MNLARLRIFAGISILLVFSGILYLAMPFGERESGFDRIVIRNWRDHGILALKGEVVCNPGGVAPGEKVKVHKALVSLSTWMLLGRGNFATAAAATAVLCPGYLRNAVSWEFVTLTVLFGLPVFAWALPKLKEPTLKPTLFVALLVLLMLYSALDWSTVFTFGIVFAYLMVILRNNPRRLFIFIAICTVSVAVVGLLCVASKLGGSTSGASLSSSLDQIYNTYLFGPGGYAYPMNWNLALVRLFTVSMVSLLPLFLLFAYCGFASWRNGTWEFAHMIPFLAGWIGILAMRNYLAHHPWVASPIVMVGIIFSLALILPGLKNAAPAVVPCSLAPAAFIYCYLIVMFLGVNDETNRIVSLVCRNTERRDVIIISASRDPDLFKYASRWSLKLDRKVFEEAERETHPLTAGSRAYQLTLTPNETLGSPINAENCPIPWGQPAIKKILHSYRTHIAQRETGDRLEIESPGYLYKLK